MIEFESRPEQSGRLFLYNIGVIARFWALVCFAAWSLRRGRAADCLLFERVPSALNSTFADDNMNPRKR